MSTHTVRRRIAELLTRLGVTTRFQAGFALGRQSLADPAGGTASGCQSGCGCGAVESARAGQVPGEVSGEQYGER